MLKKYILLFLLPLSMTSFGQSLPLHAEQDASENSQQTLEKETQKALNEGPQQVLKENSQQALSKEMVIKNVDLEKATLRSRFFAGGLTLFFEGIMSFVVGFGITFVCLLGFQIDSGDYYAAIVTACLTLTSLLFSLFAGCMSFNALFKLKIVGKNGEDTTFVQRFWYAFSFFLLPFVCYIVETIVFSLMKNASMNTGMLAGLAPFFVILIAQGALVGIKKKTISEYVTGLQVVKKKPSAPVKK